MVTKTAPQAHLTPALDFAFTVVRRLTSNAIAVCQGPSLVGAGIGQTSRVDATKIALEAGPGALTVPPSPKSIAPTKCPGFHRGSGIYSTIFESTTRTVEHSENPD